MANEFPKFPQPVPLKKLFLNISRAESHQASLLENMNDSSPEYWFDLIMEISNREAIVSAQVIAETVMDSVPAGKFQTINYKSTYIMGTNYQQGGSIRYVSNKYAEKVGLVYKTLPFNYANSNYEVLLLNRYGKTK